MRIRGLMPAAIRGKLVMRSTLDGRIRAFWSLTARRI